MNVTTLKQQLEAAQNEITKLQQAIEKAEKQEKEATAIKLNVPKDGGLYTNTVPSVKSGIKTGSWKIIKEEENMTTKLKPFNLEKALAGEKVVTRDGRNIVEIVKLNKVMGACNIVGVTEGGIWYSYTSDGCYWTQWGVSDNDLFMTTTKKQGWMNIYDSHAYNVMAGGGNIYKTYQEAAENSVGEIITTVMVEWEE